MQILTILLLSVLILFPLGELLRFNLGNSIYLKPLDIMVGLTSLVWFCSYLIQKKKHTVKIKKYFYLFPLIGLLSLLIHIPYLQQKEIIVAGLYLVRFVAYLSIIFVVAQFTASIKQKFITILFYVGLAFVIFGFVQYFFFNDLRYFVFLGWDDHMFRLFSTFFDPNFAVQNPHPQHKRSKK